MEPTSRILPHIDHKTARSICDEVGDRLQRDLALETSPLPPYLERLIDQLRKRDRWVGRIGTINAIAETPCVKDFKRVR